MELPIADCRLSIFDLRRAYPLGWLTQRLIKAQNGALTLRDVKNEDRPGYVPENKGDGDKMSSEKHGFYTRMHELDAN